MNYKDFLKNEKGCPFCNIKIIDQQKIIENNSAFLTIALAPYKKYHLLVIPRRHVTHMVKVTDEENLDIIHLEHTGIQLLKKLGHTSITIMSREGKTTGRTVKHLHYHIIPDISLSVLDFNFDKRKVYSKKEMSEMTKKLKRILGKV